MPQTGVSTTISCAHFCLHPYWSRLSLQVALYRACFCFTGLCFPISKDMFFVKQISSSQLGMKAIPVLLYPMPHHITRKVSYIYDGMQANIVIILYRTQLAE